MTMSEGSATDRKPRKSWLAQAVDILAKLGLLAGGAFAVLQFLDAKEEARVQRTMTYIARYEDGSVNSARQTIGDALRPYLAQFSRISEDGGVTGDDRDAMVMTLVESGSGKAIDAEIDTIVDFYEGLAICVAEAICERRVVLRYFARGEAQDFYGNFEPYIRMRRINTPTYAEGLRQIMSMPDQEAPNKPKVAQ